MTILKNISNKLKNNLNIIFPLNRWKYFYY